MPNLRSSGTALVCTLSLAAAFHGDGSRRAPSLPPHERHPIGAPHEPAAAILARLEPRDEWADAALFIASVTRWEHLPPYDPTLAPGEVELAPTPLYWAPREPGRLVAGRRSDWPESVERLLIERAAERYQTHQDAPTLALELGAPWPKGARAFRTILPGGLTVYALEHPAISTGPNGLSLVLHDPHTDRTSPTALSLTRLWSHADRSGPRAWTADLDGDGQIELAFLATFHNGTDMNATGRVWLTFAEDLSLSLLRYTADEEPYTVDSHGGAGLVRVRLIRTPEGSLREDAWFENPAFHFTPRQIPSEILADIHGRLAADEPLLNPLPRVR